jgi:hypothetical protein
MTALPRRIARRARRELAALLRTTVRPAGDDGVRMGRRTYRLDDPAARHRVRGGRLRLVLPDAAWVVRLAAAGLLTGDLLRLRVRLASSPEWLVTGLRPPRLGRNAAGFRWRRRGSTLTVDFGWSRPYPVYQGLADAVAAVLRYRTWEQVSGPAQSGVGLAAITNPFGRRLVGAATHYRLVSGQLRDDAGQVVREPDKYAVVSVDSDHPALPALAARGMVFVAADPAVRAALDAQGLVAVRDPKEVDDLRGYALSVEASRRALIAGDATLRRTALAGEGTLPLPTVSVVLSSMRADHIESCLGHLAAQTYPALEVLVGLHGYEVEPSTEEKWRATLRVPLRITTFPAELPFGAVLGRLSRMADGELITKVDDDDHYGRQHVADLVIAWHTSGADLAAKGSRFVHLPDREQTIDRAWAAPELFNVTPAGGTLLLARSTLQQVGGWSHAPRHVDTDLLNRVKAAGGLVYRTHALEYVYVRRTAGHTWVTELDELVAQGERTYQGLPPEILRPDYATGS